MDAVVRDELVEAIIAAPAGAALLARLEASVRGDLPPWEGPAEVDDEAVAEAVRVVAREPKSGLVREAVAAAEGIAGPWVPGAPGETAKALRDAPRRRDLCVAVVDRLGSLVTAPINRDRQEWWNEPSSVPKGHELPTLGPPFSHSHEFGPVGCVDTVTSGVDDLAEELWSAWDMADSPVSRWRLEIDPGARIYEVQSPEDWRRLVTDHPHATRAWGHWELPSINQRAKEIAPLAVLPDQHAMRTEMRRFLVPDWNAVARDWDGVHLTWAGFLTCEGYIVDLPDGDVAMLRHWGTRRRSGSTGCFRIPSHCHRSPRSASTSKSTAPAAPKISYGSNADLVGRRLRGQHRLRERVAVEGGGVLAAHGAQFVGRDVAP